MRVVLSISSLSSVLLFSSVIPASSYAASAQDSIPLDPEHWTISNDSVEFVKREGFHNGLIVMKSVKENSDPVAILRDVKFENGTIEFDVKPDGGNWPTVRFHKMNDSTAEEFYIRPSDDCPASADCTQYAPVLNGRMLWDAYPQYQHSAPFRSNEWNHVKMVVSGKRLNVFFNHESQPSLHIGQLMGDEETGAIEFQGAATFANISVTGGVVDGLKPGAEVDPSTLENGTYLREWLVAAPTPLSEDREPVLADSPQDGADWRPINAERFGMVNLARAFGPATTREVPVVAWLMTDVDSPVSEVVHASLGFSRRIVVFVNGKEVYSGHNLYNTKGERKGVDGRISIDNDSFDLPLQKGMNKILVAISSNSRDMRDIYSYGLEFRINDPRGLSLSR